jgi:hypothetical protein
METLSAADISQFVEHGFVKIENAFSSQLAGQCRDLLWQEIRLDPTNPATWTQPVIRIGELGAGPFRKAANTPALHQAFDQLVGKDRWLPRMTLGSFPIRFPSREPANDTGWHVDASFPGNDPSDYLHWRINIHSRGRALLMLFLFSDVSERDAPTIIRVGSHADVARLLSPAGAEGLSFMELARKLHPLPERDITLATGQAGTVYLCHPFLVHAAQDHRGLTPKFMAQPPLLTKHDFFSNPAGSSLCPVEQAIANALQE